MCKIVAIDPGISKCGVIFVDINDKKVYEAFVIKSCHLLDYVKKKFEKYKNIQCLLGNGTSSKIYVEALRELVPKLIITEEKNSTYRAKQRYFDIFPLKGFKKIIPREIFLLNKNLDALAALIILEDFYKLKFDINDKIETKTWLK